MIEHVVMWKLKLEAEGRNASDNALLIKDGLEALLGLVPQLRACRVGVNIAEGNYDLCLIADFNSMEELEAYKIHPEHVKIASYCRLVCASRVACDFEIRE